MSKHRILQQDQLDSYKDQGFVILQGLLTDEEVGSLAAWTSEVQQWPETAGKWMQYFEKTDDGGRLLCRTENILDYHEQLNRLIRGKITDAVSDAIGEQAVLFKEKINYKLPGGAGFPAHQDAPAYVTFQQRYHVTAMIAVDRSTTTNGCLEVVAGEHTKGIFEHPNNELDPQLSAGYEAAGAWQPVEAQPGTVLIFHSHLPHRSGPNSTDQPRRAYYLTFNPASDGDFRSAYYADKRVMFPPEIERAPGKDYSEGAKVYNLATPILNNKMD